MKKPMALEPWLYLAAIGLFVIDILAMLVLSGGVRFRRRAVADRRHLARAGAPADSQPSRRGAGRAGNGSATAPEAGATTSPASPADFALKASLQTHLAYVITGDPEIDRTSEEGLSGLSKVLARADRARAGRSHGRRYR